MAIENLGNRIARQIWNKGKSKDLPKELNQRAKFLLEIMNATSSITDLSAKGEPPALRAHKLTGNNKGRWAIDITKSSGWRITFEFKDGKFIDVVIEDYHE